MGRATRGLGIEQMYSDYGYSRRGGVLPNRTLNNAALGAAYGAGIGYLAGNPAVGAVSGALAGPLVANTGFRLPGMYGGNEMGYEPYGGNVAEYGGDAAQYGGDAAQQQFGLAGGRRRRSMRRSRSRSRRMRGGAAPAGGNCWRGRRGDMIVYDGGRVAGGGDCWMRNSYGRRGMMMGGTEDSVAGGMHQELVNAHLAGGRRRSRSRSRRRARRAHGGAAPLAGGDFYGDLRRMMGGDVEGLGIRTAPALTGGRSRRRRSRSRRRRA